MTPTGHFLLATKLSGSSKLLPIAEVLYFEVRHRAWQWCICALCTHCWLHHSWGQAAEIGIFWPQVFVCGIPLISLLTTSSMPRSQLLHWARYRCLQLLPAQLLVSARDHILVCDLIQGVFSRKIQFPAGTRTTDTTAWGHLPTEGAAPALHAFSSWQPHVNPTKTHCKFFTLLGAKSIMSAAVQQRLKGPPGPVIYLGEGKERMCLTGRRIAAPMQGKIPWEAKAGVTVWASDQD